MNLAKEEKVGGLFATMEGGKRTVDIVNLATLRQRGGQVTFDSATSRVSFAFEDVARQSRHMERTMSEQAASQTQTETISEADVTDSGSQVRAKVHRGARDVTRCREVFSALTR